MAERCANCRHWRLCGETAMRPATRQCCNPYSEWWGDETSGDDCCEAEDGWDLASDEELAERRSRGEA